MQPLVAVLAGGVSPEHDVSLVSAAEVLNGLVARGYPTLAVWIDRRGGWHVLASDGEKDQSWSPNEIAARGKTCPPQTALIAVDDLVGRGVDVVFPALHGRGGEDGSVQALLELAGLACVGSGRLASAVGMSKLLTRLALVGAGLPMAPAYLPTRAEARRLAADEVACRLERQGLRYPLFLKEDACGSSLNVERLAAPEQLAAALARVRAAGDYWLVEQGVTGIEVTVAVLGNAGGELRGLPPVEIQPKRAAFFDYASKYDGDATDELCPPPSLSAAECERLQQLAITAHETLGCRGFSRTDMFLALPDRRPVLLEINTIPGLTPQSLLPRAARAAGLAFPELMATVVDLALQREEGVFELPRPASPRPARLDGRLPV